MNNRTLLLCVLLTVFSVSVVGGGVLRWLFGGGNNDNNDHLDETATEGNEDYDEDSSEEAPDGPFQMITETNFKDEDYYDL